MANRFVRLIATDTKTSEPRVVFLGDQAYDILKNAGGVRSPDHNRVFTHRGKPLKKIKKVFTNACRKAGISNFRFLDLCPTCNPNLRKAGFDHPVIMKRTRHQTASLIQRRHRVDVVAAKDAYQKLEELLSQE
jgi:integrase